MSTNVQEKLQEGGEEETQQEEGYRSISIDQAYVLDRLPLSPEQKRKLIEQLRAEADIDILEK